MTRKISMNNKLKISLLKERLSVCRLSADDYIPDWALNSKVFSITKTYDELSIVCDEELVPKDIKHEGNWRALKIEGPLDFSLVGILSRISSILAERSVSIFAVSTYDTDYILVKGNNINNAIQALEDNGYEIT